MILFVLSMHAAVTYSGRGGWYYTEPSDLSRTTLILFTFYQSYLQSFFMGLLFFLAGYFVPKAYDTKGTSKFLKDRAVRLGVPTLLYIFIIGPLTEYYVSFSWHPDPIDRSFLQEYTNYILRFRFPGGTGPLWFCATLLIFCAGYALLKSFSPKKEALPEADDPPDTRTVFAFIVLVSVTTFLFRVPWQKELRFTTCNFVISRNIFYFLWLVLAPIARIGWRKSQKCRAGIGVWSPLSPVFCGFLWS